MSDFKSLNGYNVKDEVARNGISEINNYLNNIEEVIESLNVVDKIDNALVEGNPWFLSGAGYSPNTITIDLSTIENLEKYNYICFYGLGSNFETGIKEVVAKIELPKGNNRYNLSPQYPCYANTTGQISESSGDIRTSYVETNTYYGSITFEVKRIIDSENNKLEIRAFQSPLHIKSTRTIKTRISTGDIISDNTTFETLYDSNGSMIVSGGKAGMYTEFSGFGLSVF